MNIFSKKKKYKVSFEWMNLKHHFRWKFCYKPWWMIIICFYFLLYISVQESPLVLSFPHLPTIGRNKPQPPHTGFQRHHHLLTHLFPPLPLSLSTLYPTSITTIPPLPYQSYKPFPKILQDLSLHLHHHHCHPHQHSIKKGSSWSSNYLIYIF